MASEVEPLLPRPRGAKATRYGARAVGRSGGTDGGPGVLAGLSAASAATHSRVGASLCACLCAHRRPISYVDIGDDVAAHIRSLIEELSVDASGPRDLRVVDALQRMWVAVACECVCEDESAMAFAAPKIPAREWRRLGFQGDDPCTDLRGAHLVGVTYTARLVEEYREARDLGVIAHREMPLGIAAINILYMLRCHLLLFTEPPAFCPCCSTHIREEYTVSQPHAGMHLHGFAHLLMEDPDAFFHVFASTVILAGCVWRKRFGASARLSAAGSSATLSGRDRTPSGKRGKSSIREEFSREPPIGLSEVLTGPAPVAVTRTINAHPRDSFTVVTRTTQSTVTDAGIPKARSSSAGTSASTSMPTQSPGTAVGENSGDARLLEFPQVLQETRAIVLEALAGCPNDYATLRSTLMQLLRASEPAGSHAMDPHDGSHEAWDAFLRS